MAPVCFIVARLIAATFWETKIIVGNVDTSVHLDNVVVAEIVQTLLVMTPIVVSVTKAACPELNVRIKFVVTPNCLSIRGLHYYYKNSRLQVVTEEVRINALLRTMV